MFCGECGTQNPDTNQFCKNCGKPLRKARQDAAPQPATVPIPPVAAPSQAQPAYYPPQPAGYAPAAAVPVAKPPRDWLGMGSIFLGVLAWLIIPYLLGCIAVILGIISIYKRRKEKNTLAIAGIIGIVIAVIAMLVNYFYIFIF